MFCPFCQKEKELEKTVFYGTEIDYCPDCFGLWLEEDELKLAKDTKDQDLRWLDIDIWQDETKFKIASGIRLCPACRLPLYEVYYGDSRIIIDACNICKGIWLERSEFKKIIEYLKNKGHYEILNNYSENLIKEFWEIFTGPETFKEEVSDFLNILKLLNYKFSAQHPTMTKIISNLPK